MAHYCATFLKPEMLHIYRQIAALQKFRSVVLTQKRENAAIFPFEEVVVVPKPGTHALRRLLVRQIGQAPPVLYRSEAARLVGELENRQASLLHIYFGNIAVHLLPLIRCAPVAVVVSFHGADATVDMDRPHFRAKMREMLGLVTLVLVRSASLGERVKELGADPGKIRIHRTGVPLDALSFQTRIPPDDGAWRFLQACRLIEKKGLPTSLRAFARFAGNHPQATFTIAGDGPMLDELRSLTRELGIDERVRFTGFVSQEDLRRLLYDAHLFLHPSELGADGNQEGVPNAILEGMATGLPALATVHGGIPEAVENGVSGLLVAERDHDALFSAMESVTASPAVYAAMSSAAAKSVGEKFDLRQTVATLEIYYDEALRRGGQGLAAASP